MPFIDLPDGPLPGVRAQASREQRPWYRIQNVAADEAEIFLYDEVGSWYGATAEDFIAELRYVTAPKILLRVNSPGGSVTEGIAIANALRSHAASVTVQVDGIAASIASVIAMAGDKVRMMPNALLMVHEASGLCVGEAADMIKMAEVLDKISDNIAGAYAARAGGTEVEWRQVMKNETWYRGEEAVTAGLADECVPIPQRGEPMPEPEPEMRQSFDFAAYGYQGPKQPEHPKPAPPATAAQTPTPSASEATLTIPIGSALGEQLAAALRASVAPESAAAPVDPELVVPAAAATAAEDTSSVVTDAAEDTVIEPEPQQPQPIVVQVHLDGPASAEAFLDAARQAVAARAEPAAPTAPSAVAPVGLAARAAHFTKPARPAAPTWRDRVAHLNPPSSATTQPAP